VYDQFSSSMTRYYQVLNALIDTPAGIAADPVPRTAFGAYVRPTASTKQPKHGPGDA
jgi:hypothetical protein